MLEGLPAAVQAPASGPGSDPGAVALAGVGGGGAAAKLKPGGFDDPAAQSTSAAVMLRDTFHGGDPNLVLLVTPVDNPAIAAWRALGRRLAAERDVSDVPS